jgi:hypothetical protein
MEERNKTKTEESKPKVYAFLSHMHPLYVSCAVPDLDEARGKRKTKHTRKDRKERKKRIMEKVRKVSWLEMRR